MMIWDDHQSRCIGELAFRSPVRIVRLRRDRVVVALDRKVYVHAFADLEMETHIETCPNPLGLLAVCPKADDCIIACPSTETGKVRVELLD